MRLSDEGQLGSQTSKANYARWVQVTMIFSRIANSITHRKWGEFAVEVVVVIIGVLLALQVDNWSEARSLRSDQTKLIQSLLEDFRENQEIAKREIQRFTRAEAASLTLMAIAQNRSEVSSGEFYSLINDALQRRTPRFAENTWTLLTADGQLTKLENSELKKQISSFYRYTSQTADAFSPNARSESDEFSQVIAEHYDMARYVYHVHPEDLSTFEYDADGLLDFVEESRPAIISLAARAWHTTFDWRRITERTLELADEIERQLTIELERLNS